MAYPWKPGQPRATLSDVSTLLSGQFEQSFHFVYTLAQPHGLSLARVEYKDEDLATATSNHYSIPLGPTPGRNKECIYLIDWGVSTFICLIIFNFSYAMQPLFTKP